MRAELFPALMPLTDCSPFQGVSILTLWAVPDPLANAWYLLGLVCVAIGCSLLVVFKTTLAVE
jgi:hypothetical protein